MGPNLPPMDHERDLRSEVTRRFLVRTVLYLVVIGAILFGAAGTFHWPEAWIYLALSAALSFGGGLWLARHDPGLLAERLGSLIQRDQKRWDKIFMAIIMALWIGWLVLIALDAKRYHWSQVPLAVQVAGFVLLCLGSYLVGLTFRENSYAAPVGQSTLASATHGETFAAVVRRGHCWGAQFHPERSAAVGARLLQNFLSDRLA